MLDSYYECVRHYSAERVAPFNAATSCGMNSTSTVSSAIKRDFGDHVVCCRYKMGIRF